MARKLTASSDLTGRYPDKHDRARVRRANELRQAVFAALDVKDIEEAHRAVLQALCVLKEQWGRGSRHFSAASGEDYFAGAPLFF